MNELDNCINKDFISVGASNFYLEKWININRRLDNHSLKPRGGLWSSDFLKDSYYICSWLDYIRDNESVAFGKYLSKSIVFKLKRNTKLCILDSKSSMNHISQKFPSFYHQLTFYQDNIADFYAIDYERLSLEYDAVYITYPYTDRKEQKHSTFECSSLLVMNPNCLKNYRSVSLSRNEYSGAFRIESIGPDMTITPLSLEYNDLVAFTSRYILDNIGAISCDNYEDYIRSVVRVRNQTYNYLINEKKASIIDIINGREGLSDIDMVNALTINISSKIITEGLDKNRELFTDNRVKCFKKISYED